MGRSILAAALGFCSVLSIAAVQAAQTAKPATTSSGIFTAAQASRGEQTYMNICVSCHPKGTYSVPAFREKWNGIALSELFAFISSTMPKVEPGSLEPEEYAQVVAYLLKINGSPAGASELAADVKAMRRIKITFPVEGK